MADVIMPQMGESIAEGTVTKWLKNVGDRVERDEPLFEISTDKVDAEIPSPAAGVLREIRVPPGTTVPVNSVVAVIAVEGEGAAVAPARDAEPGPPPTLVLPTVPPVEYRIEDEPAGAPAPPLPPAVPPPPPRALLAEPVTELATPAQEEAALPPAERPRSEMTAEELRLTRSSPLVRKIAADHQVDIRAIPGTGIGGRVTKQDILGHIETRSAAAETPLRAAPPPAGPPLPAAW